MFGRKKMYKKGMADALRANEAFAKKQEEAIAHIREEVKSGQKKLEEALAGLGEEIFGVYQYLTSKEKAALYKLSTPMDIKSLEDEEKRLLLAMLYQLANDEGEAVTDQQRAYIRSVQKYLEITNPQTSADLTVVENIENLGVQKALLQVALEFFYLQEGDELSDAQEEFLGYFSVNQKQAALIENDVSRLFNAVGPEGIAEKYGYVPEEDEADAGEMRSASRIIGIAEHDKVIDNAIAKVIRDIGINGFIKLFVETENYCLVVPFNHEYVSNMKLLSSTSYASCIDKRNGKVQYLAIPFEYYRIINVERYILEQDTVVLNVSVYERGWKNHVGFLNLQTMDYKEIDVVTQFGAWCVKGSYIVCGQKPSEDEVIVYNGKSGHTVRINIGIKPFAVADIIDNRLFLMKEATEYANGPKLLYEIDIDKQIIIGKYTVPLSATPRAIRVLKDTLYCFAYGDEYNYSSFGGNDYSFPHGLGNRIISYSLNDGKIKEISTAVYPSADYISDMDIYFPPVFRENPICTLEDRMLFYLSNGRIAQLLYNDKEEISILVNESSLEYVPSIWGTVKLVGPVPCFRKWVYFKNKNSNKPFRVNMDNPEQVEAVVERE